MPFNENTYYKDDKSLGLNGRLLLLEAIKANKVAVFVSSHGPALKLSWSFGPKTEKWVLQNKNFEETNGITIKDIISDFKGKDFGNDFLESKNSLLISWKVNELGQQLVPGVNKENSVGWELAFAKLSEEFNLNEKPTEFPKIPMK